MFGFNFNQKLADKINEETNLYVREDKNDTLVPWSVKIDSRTGCGSNVVEAIKNLVNWILDVNMSLEDVNMDLEARCERLERQLKEAKDHAEKLENKLKEKKTFLIEYDYGSSVTKYGSSTVKADHYIACPGNVFKFYDSENELLSTLTFPLDRNVEIKTINR